jgi:hypothetical protein
VSPEKPPHRSDLASSAGEKVAEIIATAEAKAEEIEAEARQQAERIVAAARAEAQEQVARAREAVAGLVSQADDLRRRVGDLGRDLGEGAAAETDPVTVPEPTVPQPEVDPSPVIVPEPEPAREPVPVPDPVPEPTPQPDIVPTTPEPDIAPPQPDQPPPAATETNGDEAGARLVAMKMALDGSTREEVERHLAESYGIGDRGELLDDVFSRVSG